MPVDAEILIDWFADNARDLPWRRPEAGAWGVLVSEIMLQQTPSPGSNPSWHDVDGALATPVRVWPRPQPGRSAASLGQARLSTPRAATARRGGGDRHASTATSFRPMWTLCSRCLASAHTPRERSPPSPTASAARWWTPTYAGWSHVRCTAQATRGPPSTTRDMADVAALLPAEDEPAARMSAALMELGAVVCTARAPRCVDCPISTDCAWQLAGRPAYDGPAKPVQRFAGTDRQVRGLLLDVLRDTTEPVAQARLDVVWADAGQRDRCLDSLLVDGLVEQTADGRFALPGEH